MAENWSVMIARSGRIERLAVALVRISGSPSAGSCADAEVARASQNITRPTALMCGRMIPPPESGCPGGLVSPRLTEPGSVPVCWDAGRGGRLHSGRECLRGLAALTVSTARQPVAYLSTAVKWQTLPASTITCHQACR